MKRLIKNTILILLGLTVLSMAALIYWLNPLAKATLIELGTSALGTPLDIENVALRPFRGSIKIEGVRIRNPGAGFSTPDLLKIKELRINIRLRSLRDQALIIRRIEMHQPELFLERDEQSNNLRNVLEQFQSPAIPVAEEPPPNPRTITIEKLDLFRPRIHLMESGKLPVVIAAESVALRESEPRFSIHHLSISNPEGYSTNSLFSIDDVVAQVHFPHIGAIDLKDLRLEAPRLVIEKKGTSDNLADFRALVFPFFIRTSSPTHAPTEITASEEPNLPLIPNRVIVAEGKLLSFNPELPKAETLRTELSFDQLAILPPEGVARIRRLTISNPRRFSHDHVLELNEFQLAVDLASINKKPLRILEINLSGPRFVFERRFRTDNITVLQSNMLGIARKADAPVPIDDVPTSPSSTRIVVDHFLMEDGIVMAKLSKLPTAPVTLPTIERFDIGTEEGGADYSTLTAEISGIIYHTILQSCTGIGGLTTDALKGSGNLILDTGSTVGSKTIDTIKGIGNLFRDDDEESAP